MPRDANGNYVLPVGNPVVSGAIIESSWANTTMSDIGNEVQGSLSRDGKGGMLAPLRFLNGTAAQPAISWVEEPATGFYRASAGDMRVTVSGVDVQRWKSGTVQVWNVTDSVWLDVITSTTSFAVKTTSGSTVPDGSGGFVHDLDDKHALFGRSAGGAVLGITALGDPTPEKYTEWGAWVRVGNADVVEYTSGTNTGQLIDSFNDQTIGGGKVFSDNTAITSQLRVTGWIDEPTVDPDGVGIEIGASAGSPVLIGYDRTANIYTPEVVLGSGENVMLINNPTSRSVQGADAESLTRRDFVETPAKTDGTPGAFKATFSGGVLNITMGT